MSLFVLSALARAECVASVRINFKVNHSIISVSATFACVR